MSTPTLPPGRRTAVVVAVMIVLAAALVAAMVGVNRVAGLNSASGVPTAAAAPSPSTPSSPSPTAAPSLAPTACASATFGPPLQPRSQPADVHKYATAPAMQIDTAKLYEATITTAKGTIVLCLQPALAPKTVNNFVVLARNHFYDGLTFHRVEAGFVIQGGDPKGDGSGGPGYSFADEKVQGTYTVGTVAMANSGPNTNGSQFFICTGAQCSSLQPQYNLFGHVVSGFDTVLAIAKGDVMTTVTVAEQS